MNKLLKATDIVLFILILLWLYGLDFTKMTTLTWIGVSVSLLWFVLMVWKVILLWKKR